MKKNFILVLILGCWTVVHADPSLALEGPSTITRGFPAVFKLRAQGPLRIPKISLEDHAAPIQIKCISEQGATYSVTSYPQWEEMAAGDGSGRMLPPSAIAHYFMVDVAAGEERSMLVDLSSLAPSGGKNGFYDIPAGGYRMSVVLTTPTAVESNQVNLKIIEPTSEERQLVGQFIAANPTLRRGISINWAKSLLVRARIGAIDSAKASEPARNQLVFHALLSELSSAQAPQGDLAVQRINAARLPAFLEAERQALALEMRTAAGKASAQDAANFAASHPDLKWRVKEMASGGGFLGRLAPPRPPKAQRDL